MVIHYDLGAFLLKFSKAKYIRYRRFHGYRLSEYTQEFITMNRNLYQKISDHFSQTDSEKEQSREDEINELLSDIDIPMDTYDDELFITYT